MIWRWGIPPRRTSSARSGVGTAAARNNGIEHGLMAAYAEGSSILRHANAGKRGQSADAETKPLRNPAYYQYDLNFADIAGVWRRGSVIAFWLLDLTAATQLQRS
jgi:6-phosphogluconate dehydrogenase